MLPALVSRYLELVDRHCDGVFYSKQWQRWYNRVDDVLMTREGYPYPVHWRRLFDTARTPRSTRNFEALYATRP